MTNYTKNYVSYVYDQLIHQKVLGPEDLSEIMEKSCQADFIVNVLNNHISTENFEERYCQYITKVEPWRSGFKKNIHLTIKVTKLDLSKKELYIVTNNILEIFDVLERRQQKFRKIIKKGDFNLEGRVIQQTVYYLDMILYRCNY